MLRIIITSLLILFASQTSADSISIGLKPSKGIAGTVSLNIHDDGQTSLLVYASPANIQEIIIDLTSAQKLELREDALEIMSSYFIEADLQGAKTELYSLSVTHTDSGLTRSITTKKLNESANEFLSALFRIVPKMKMDYIKD